PARLLLDIADTHIAVLVLRHLAGDEDEIPRPHRRMEGQIRVLLADRLDVLAHWAPLGLPSSHTLPSPRRKPGSRGNRLALATLDPGFRRDDGREWDAAPSSPSHSTDVSMMSTPR